MFGGSLPAATPHPSTSAHPTAHQVLEPEHNTRFCAVLADHLWHARLLSRLLHHSSHCTPAQHEEVGQRSGCAGSTCWSPKGTLVVPQPKMSFSWSMRSIIYIHIYTDTQSSDKMAQWPPHDNLFRFPQPSVSIQPKMALYQLKINLHWAVLENPQKQAVFDLSWF